MMVQCNRVGPVVTACRPVVAVTAVSQLPDKSIIAGYSSFLVNLDHNDQVRVFKHQAIHCLAVSNFMILVCGGRSIAIVDGAKNLLITKHEARLKDCIITASWTPSSQIAVLFSYNSFTLFDEDLTELQSVGCEMCCIIYGGVIRLEDPEVVCVSGTVFNEPLLWKPSNSSKVLQQYKGHTGVIFDVRLTSDRLYSVSDDRTLVIWDRGSGRVLHRLFGHAARVLKVRLLSELAVVTAGEDNKCCVWSRDSGALVQSITPHRGNGIRSVYCQGDTIVTGGWDSSVVKYSFLGCPDRTQTTHNSLSLPNNLPKWVVWLNKSELLVQLTDGEIHLYDHLFEGYKILLSTEESVFKDYSKFAKLRDNSVVVGSIRGEICVVDGSDKSLTHHNLSRTTKVWSITSVSVGGDDESQFVVSCQDEGFVTLFQTRRDKTTQRGAPLCTIRTVSHLTLPNCRSRWVTAACLVNQHLVVGDRRGGVHLYKLTSHQDPSSPESSITGLHGDNGVSQVSCDDDVITTLGRDGNVRSMKIREDKLIIFKKERPLAGVLWIERMDKVRDQTLLYYFHGQEFKVTVLETLDTIFSVECGGGHRSWDILLSAHEQTVNFVYINRPRIRCVTGPVSLSPFTRYNPQSHGSEIHAGVYVGECLVTVGEDCHVAVHLDGRSLKVPGHISSVRSVCASPGGEVIFTAGGRGSLKSWCLNESDVTRSRDRKLDLHLKADYTVVSNTHIPVGYSSSYRFDKRNPDNDQRVMGVDCIKSRDPKFSVLCSCGLSNSKVFLLGYTPDDRFIRISSFSLTNCITRVRLLEVVGSDSVLVLSTTTFGKLQLNKVSYNNEGSYSLESESAHQLHTSGINGLDVRLEPSYQVVTIGDDGDVILTSLSRDLLSSEVLRRQTVHFSAGIAVRFLGSDHMITTGSDQRLVILALHDLTPMYCCYTDVPDPHNLALRRGHDDESTVMVCGKGYQEFVISNL